MSTDNSPTLSQNVAIAEKELRKAKRNVGRVWRLVEEMKLILKRI